MTELVDTLLTSEPHVAAAFIQRGEIVGFPTETVYGLAADIFSQEAIRKVFLAKGRPADNPLIAHVASSGQIDQLVTDIPVHAKVLIDSFFPGPLTLVMRKRAEVPLIASGGLDTIGVRMPGLALARTFIAACGVPLVAPSANLSGSPSPTTWQAVVADLSGRIACILQGPPAQIGLESTVVDCTGDEPVILRAGGVTLEQLRAVCPDTRRLEHPADARPRSPGLKYRHYAPRAKVMIVSHGAEPEPGVASAWIGLHRPASRTWHPEQQCADVADYAHELFGFFRACDAAGAQVICCEAVAETGLGVALMDRITRAARG